VLSIDPAVTTTEKSDFTGLAVVAYSAVEKRCVVRDAWELRIQPGKALRDRVIQILDAYPDTAAVLVETNQGGDVWRAILHNLPVPIHTVHQKTRKEIRASDLLTHYQRGRVVHEKTLHAAEAQMVSFPKAPHDDLIDAIGSGVHAILPSGKAKPNVRTSLVA
jgi:predicted phage terminase large subunit-like protein